jgi:hypothetical protein
MAQVVRYAFPVAAWIRYRQEEVFQHLIDTKAAVYALTTTPFQRAWVERLQEVQLKMEVAGTSRIEGAEFTDRELETALKGDAPEELLTRSQRQARAAVQSYPWIAVLSPDRLLTPDLHHAASRMADRDY